MVSVAVIVVDVASVEFSLPQEQNPARKRMIKNDFAQEHFGIEDYTYQPKLNFGSTSNGVGLIFSF